MALLLYLAASACLAIAWSRFVQRVSVGAAIALIALPLLFTGRAMFTGRVYAPLDLPFTAEPLRDYAQDFGVAKPHDIALSDLHCQIIPWQKAVRYALSQGQWPLWNPFVFNGDILAAVGQAAVYDPVQWIGFLIPLPDALTFGAAMTFFLAAFFTFAFARASGLREIAAFVAAAGFALCGMMAFFVGWPLARAWAYLPLVLFGVRLIAGRSGQGAGGRGSGDDPLRPAPCALRPPGGAAILILALVLTVFAGHPESVLHVVFVGVLYGLSLKPNLRAIALALFAGAAALGLAAVYLMPFAEAAPLTVEYKIRNDLYAKASYGELVTPAVRAERIGKTFVPFYDPDPSRPGWDPLSARVGVLVMALAVFGAFDRRRWFWVALAIVGFLATFGTWPVAHALHALPLFDIAINERLALAASFALAMLAAMAVDRLNPKLAIALLGLILLERAAEDGRFYPAIAKRAFYPRVPVVEAIPRDARITGVGHALIPNNATLYELEDVRGYTAMLNIRLYDTFPLWCVPQDVWFNRVDDLSRPFLSFLNVRYALARADVAPPDGWVYRATDRHTHLLENTRVLPRAFVPRHVRYTPANPIDEMKANNDFAGVAWIELADREPHLAPNGPGTVTIQRKGLEYHLDATMERAGWVVLSVTHWPGWRAYVDGTRVRTHPANHAFLGVHVPQGKHSVRLVYLPESFTRGRAISLSVLSVLLVLSVLSVLSSRRCSPSSSTPRSPSR